MIPIEYGAFQFPPSQEQAEIQEKILIKSMMEVANIASLPARALSDAVVKFLETPSVHPAQDHIRKVGLELRQDLGKLIKTYTPEEIKALWTKSAGKVEALKSQLKEEWFLKYHIPRKDTDFFFESVEHNLSYLGVWGTGKLASRLTKAVNKPKMSFAYNYFEDKAAFSRSKEFTGVLKKDLVIVRYHNEGSIINRSWKWWSTPTEANKLDTLTKVKNRLALLNSFGEKSHVTLAKIPKGTRVSLTHGRAKSQFVPGKLNKNGLPEFRPGGGYQMRLKEFDENWIVETRLLSNGSMVKPGPGSIVKVPAAFNNRPQALFLNSLRNADAMEEAAQKMMDFAQDLTGMNLIVDHTKAVKQMLVQMISNPHHAPKLLINQILHEPEKLFQKVIDNPKEFVAKLNSFSAEPNLIGAIGVVASAFAIASLANEILPVMTKISHQMLKNPLKAPQVITKEMFNLTINKVKGIWYLAKGLATNPIKTGKDMFKGMIKTPENLVNNIKNMFGGEKRKKRKAKRKAEEQAQLQAAIQQEMVREQEQLKTKLEIAVPVCYKTAINQWMIKYNKTIDTYFTDLLEDWTKATSNGLFKDDITQFVAVVTSHLKEGRLTEAFRLSPRAHLSEPVAPPLVAFALVELAQETLKLASNRKKLDNVIAENKTAATDLSKAINSYAATNQAFALTQHSFAASSQSFTVEQESYAAINDLTEINSILTGILADENKIQALRASIATHKPTT